MLNALRRNATNYATLAVGHNHNNFLEKTFINKIISSFSARLSQLQLSAAEFIYLLFINVHLFVDV